MGVIERLIDEADGYGDGQVVVHDIEGLRALLREAAAEIEALRAEVTALQREVGELHMRKKRAEAYAAEKVSETLQAVMARRDAEERAERLAEALRRYGQHDDTCGVNTFGQIRCTCGFSAALQGQEDCNEG